MQAGMDRADAKERWQQALVDDTVEKKVYRGIALVDVFRGTVQTAPVEEVD